MASIVLAAAASSAATSLGAGTFFAAVAGGAGGFLGGFVDRAIFGGGKTRINQEGSRLTDLMVQFSTYGKAIPIIYGNSRIAGNVIWSRPIKESVTTTTQSSGGGKGGGGGGSVETTTTTYSYSVSMAIAICEGPITEVVRVWADSKPLDLTQGSYSLYLGNETQLPDTFISSFHPAGQTPAYRGMAYVVIKDFPLADYGNRIPNFTFEVRRTLKKPFDLEDKIKEISLIPGAGEYVYDTVVQEKTFGQQDVAGNFVQGGKINKLNLNNLSNKADSLVALDNLKATLPNVEYVSVILNWFADSADPAVCTIKPGVEFDSQGARVAPDDWVVAGFTRNTGHPILEFPDGSPTYGGTPTDKSIVRLCQELKARGYKVLFYPMLQVDTITPQSKPWRGRITPINATDANNFFTRSNGYNAFINHYANLNVGGVLLKNTIDAFMIGSELIVSNLTSPAVLCFLIGAFAALVKSDLRVPAQVHETLSMYLLFAIGLKGGIALSQTDATTILYPALVTLALGVITPITAYALARKIGKLDTLNAAALAAHYGSVSAVTFMAAIYFADQSGIAHEGFLTALLVVLEIPGIVVALMIAGYLNTTRKINVGKVVHEAVTGKSVILLTGGLLVGLLADRGGLESISNVFVTPFQGVLAFFLLEMGVVAASRLKEAKSSIGFLLIYGTAVPVLFGCLGVIAGHLVGLSHGGVAILATMAASASYIAAPAAVKMALPDANPSLYLTASISITLPFNIAIGIPLYFTLAAL